MLKIINKIPHEFLNININKITDLFTGPTILFEESDLAPLFVSILLHGNETSSLIAVQNYLKNNLTLKRKRGLAIFIGNPQAAQRGVRHLDTQLDYNRIWLEGSSVEHLMANQVKKFIQEKKCYAAIDLHNNSGKNPIYGCVNRKKLLHIKMAECFSKHLVYFTEPKSVFSVNINEFCPTITVECGLSGNQDGIQAAINLIEKLMDENCIWQNNKIQNESVLFTYATVYLSSRAKIDYEFNPDTLNDISFLKNLDELNFKNVSAGTQIAFIQDVRNIKVINNHGQNIFEQIFTLDGNRLICNKEIIPSMFTKDSSIAKSDALGYLMRPYSLKDFN